MKMKFRFGLAGVVLGLGAAQLQASQTSQGGGGALRGS